MVYPHQVPKSLKDEEKFLHLTRLYIKFSPDSYQKPNEDIENEEDEEFIFDNEKFEHDAQIFQRFKKYLEEKCPKLKNCINMKHDEDYIIYESQEITDLKAKREAEAKRQSESDSLPGTSIMGMSLAKAISKGLVQSRYPLAKKEN